MVLLYYLILLMLEEFLIFLRTLYNKKDNYNLRADKYDRRVSKCCNPRPSRILFLLLLHCYILYPPIPLIPGPPRGFPLAAFHLVSPDAAFGGSVDAIDAGRLKPAERKL